MSTEGTRRAIVAAFLANLGIALAKLVGFLLTGAASLLAEAIHSLADTGNQGLLVVGGRKAARPPDEAHPFGHGAERWFWAFVVALVLFSLGGLFALTEGVDKLVHPHSVDSPGIAITILLVAAALEGWSFHTARREAAPQRSNATWIQFIRRTKSPELPVVLLEDTGALVGLVFALIGITLATVTGNERFDAMGSIAIGVLLVAIALALASEMKSLLIGESASRSQQAAIREAILAGPDVARLIHLRTLHLGPEEILVGAKLELRAPTIEALTRAIDVVEARIRAAVPTATVIYIEPDVYRPAEASDVSGEPEGDQREVGRDDLELRRDR